MLEFAAEPERQFSTAEIAGKYGASAHHLAKVLGRLKRAGLVAAARSGAPQLLALIERRLGLRPGAQVA